MRGTLEKQKNSLKETLAPTLSLSLFLPFFSLFHLLKNNKNNNNNNNNRRRRVEGPPPSEALYPRRLRPLHPFRRLFFRFRRPKLRPPPARALVVARWPERPPRLLLARVGTGRRHGRGQRGPPPRLGRGLAVHVAVPRRREDVGGRRAAGLDLRVWQLGWDHSVCQARGGRSHGHDQLQRRWG